MGIYQDSLRALPIGVRSFRRGHIKSSAGAPCPSNGEHLLPGDLKEALRFFAVSYEARIRESSSPQLRFLREIARGMRPEGEAARNCSSAEERQTKKRPTRPSERNFRTPVIWRAMHGRAGWRRDSRRRDMQPDLDRTPHGNIPAAASREDMIMGGQKRFRVPKKKPGAHDAPLWQEAQFQGWQGWIDGPRCCTASG